LTVCQRLVQEILKEICARSIGKAGNDSAGILQPIRQKAPLVNSLVFAPATAGHQQEKSDRLLGKGWRPIPGSEGVFWMDLNLTAEEKQFRDELRSWLEANVPKDWSEWRESLSRILHVFESLAAETVRRRMGRRVVAERIRRARRKL